MITIIPAIDIIEGKCVRLHQGDFNSKKIYNEDPLSVACQFEAAGIQRLHLVDLDGARQGEVINWRVLERIASKTGLVIDFGGGLRSNDDLKMVFESGADMITAGSIAVKEPARVFDWIRKYGADKIILGTDVKNGTIAIHGWTEDTEYDLFQFLETFIEKGITQTICTDVSRDGMLQGPAFDLYREIKKSFPDLYVVASGGIGNIDDVYRLNDDGIDAVIIGKAIYENRIRLSDLKELLC